MDDAKGHMMTHHLIRRHPRDLLQLLKRNGFVSPPQSHPRISPNASSNFLFPFVPSSSLQWMRSDLL